jgi:succinyl-diaminopimelate desuccinylase
VTTEILRRAQADAASVAALASELIRSPSRGGIDDYEPVLATAEDWLNAREVPARRLVSADGESVAVVAEIEGGRPGPTWVLDACLDTAPFGDESAWSFSPTAGDIHGEHFLRGRGAADSKTAAAMFCHIAAALTPQAERLTGRLVVLLDVDEHTGNFGGAVALMNEHSAESIGGVMIGYPGLDELVVGGRGVYRARLNVHGTSGHSGSSRAKTINAASRAARLVAILESIEMPAMKPNGFPLPPKLTVTEIISGQGFTTVPDKASVALDMRLTDVLTADIAAEVVRAAASRLDDEMPGPAPTSIDPVLQWPPYQLEPTDPLAAAILEGARLVGLNPVPRVAGPSNIGNLFATRQIAATAGFGLPFSGLHAADEQVDLAALPAVQAAYHHAILSLLQA